jgi:hypothetical protein
VRTCTAHERYKETDPKRNVLAFDWNPAEAVNGNQFLTPVYFNKQVLTRYLYDSRFSCEFASETYGTVNGPDFDISFGINKNGSVIAWLGDLQERIPIRERFYWLVENKQPENEVASEFYDAQIDAQFTPPPGAIRCLNKLAKLNALFHQKIGVHLYHDRSIEERVEETRRYKRLVLNNADDFKRFISELNEIINENANNAELRKILTMNGILIPAGAKGNKLLQAVYESVLGDTENLIGPFFWLYDLRLWADHSMGNENLEEVARKLGVQPHDYQPLLEALIAAIDSSAEALIIRTEA